MQLPYAEAGVYVLLILNSARMPRLENLSGGYERASFGLYTWTKLQKVASQVSPVQIRPTEIHGPT